MPILPASRCSLDCSFRWLSYLLVRPPLSGSANQQVYEQDRLVLRHLPLRLADPINDCIYHRPVNQPLGALGGHFGARRGGGMGELDLYREAGSGAGPSQNFELPTATERTCGYNEVKVSKSR